MEKNSVEMIRLVLDNPGQEARYFGVDFGPRDIVGVHPQGLASFDVGIDPR